MSKSVTSFQLNKACFAAPENKPEGREVHKQAALEVGEKYISGPTNFEHLKTEPFI